MSKKKKKIDFGTTTYHCTNCGHDFELEWETIWDIQELTHGYVGYHLYDTFIGCERCGEIILNENDSNCGKEEPTHNNKYADDDLPF